MAKFSKDFNDLKALFKYYKEKHSNVMIDVNQSCKKDTVINAEADDWEAERPAVYLTQFKPFHERSKSSDDHDVSEGSATSSSSSKRLSGSKEKSHSGKSDTSSSPSKSKEKAGPSQSSDHDDDTLPDADQNLAEDFDDISETVDQDSKPEIKTSNPGPASFDARRLNSPVNKRQEYLKENKRFIKPGSGSKSKPKEVELTPGKSVTTDKKSSQVSRSSPPPKAESPAGSPANVGQKGESSPNALPRATLGEDDKQIVSQPEQTNAAYRFSFASKEYQEAYEQSIQMRNRLNDESDNSIDILANIQRTKDYLQPSVKSAYGLKPSPRGMVRKNSAPKGTSEQHQEYDLEAYQNKTRSAAAARTEMQMRPTVSPKELDAVRKYETVQNIIKNKHPYRKPPTEWIEGQRTPVQGGFK